MVVLIVTCPPGREGDAILELEWALEGVRVRGTDWRGLLIAESPLSKEETIERLKRFETQAIQRVVPLDLLVPASPEVIEQKAIELMRGKTGTFAVRARVRGNKRLKEKDLERSVGAAVVKAYGLKVNLTDPDWTVVIEVLGKKAGVGVLCRNEILRFQVVE